MTRDGRICVIGLCGRSGAGKSFISRFFESEGIPALDTDAIYHELTGRGSYKARSPVMMALAEEFGQEIVAADSSLDRRALSEIVFSPGADEKRARLNELTHKFILDEVDRRIASLMNAGTWAVLVDAPLLFESAYDKKCDYIILATAPEDVLLERIVRRDGIDVSLAKRRVASQMSDAQVGTLADFIVETDDTQENLALRVSSVVSEIRRRWIGG